MNTIFRKSLLYKSGVKSADFAINHVEGCSHGCRYPCYAMMMKKRFGIVKTYDEWIQPKLVGNSLELLDRELPRLKDKISSVYMCFSTDPFMYRQDEVAELTLKILEKLNNYSLKAVLISKGVYPLELAGENAFNPANEYGASIVSLSEEFREKYEPNAAPFRNRIDALKTLHEAGLRTWVNVEPYPTPNIVRQDLREILEQVAFVDRIVFGKWNYSGRIGEFAGSRQFYDTMASEVTDFCEGHSIELYLKKGTISATRPE